MEKRHWEENGGLEEIICYAPIWNNENWVSKSQKIFRQNLTKLKAEELSKKYFFHADNPKVTILPQSPAAKWSQNDVLYIKRNVRQNFHWSFKLNCSFKEPIEWKITEQKVN